MRIGTKSLLGLSFKQVGLWFIHPFIFGSSPPLSRLSRLYSSPSTSFPFVHQTLSVSLLCFLYIMIYSDYLLCRSCLRIATKYKYLLLLVVLSWCEDRIDTGKDLALVELGRRQVGNLELNLSCVSWLQWLQGGGSSALIGPQETSTASNIDMKRNQSLRKNFQSTLYCCWGVLAISTEIRKSS